MTTLQLSDVTPGKLQPLRKWNAAKQLSEEISSRDKLLDSLVDRKFDWKSRTVQQTMFLRKPVLAAGEWAQRNYMTYLEKCWADHLGVVVSPDILWHTILGELVQIVKSDPERFRHLFSETQEKQTVIIVTGEMVDMPLQALVDSLSKLVPTNSALFLPRYSTSTDMSQHAFNAMFCDLCSPYYDYGMMCCGLPAIRIEGTEDDWRKLSDDWALLLHSLATVLPAETSKWAQRVTGTLIGCMKSYFSPEWWQQMFSLKRCGSGSQEEVFGWYADLFWKQPSLRTANNFSTCLGVVEYEQLDTKRRYKLQSGLLTSKMEDEFLVPQWGYTVHEYLQVEPEQMTDEFGSGREEAVKRLLARLLVAAESPSAKG